MLRAARVNQFEGVCQPVDVGADVLVVAEKIRELQGSRLRRLREGAGLSQQDVADALGVSKQAVSKWERDNSPGDRWPELAVLFGVAEQYPCAPFEPGARREWVEVRSATWPGARDAPSRKVERNG
jgi:DNA-binding XRE family transcriptional regulator